MKHKIRMVALICFAGLAMLLARPFDSYSFMRGRGEYAFRSGPTLLSPTTDNIVLTGKDYLEFRWLKTDLAETDYFDFRLYKGYNATASNLIFKKRFSADTYPIQIPASMFEAGQVYTWALGQVYMTGEKSDRSFSSFRVIKK